MPRRWGTLSIFLIALVGSAVAAQAATAPTLSVPFPALPSEAVAPSAHALATIKRDCGFSVELSDGKALWIFCDSSDVNAGGGFTYFKENTAAYAWPGSPTNMREPVTGTGTPFQFIDRVTSYDPCTGSYAGQDHVIWPLSATRVPGSGGRDRILIWFENLCYGGGGTISSYTQMSVGVADYLHDPTDPDPVPELAAGARVLDPDVFRPRADGKGSFGEAAVAGGDGYVYVYRCAGLWGCQVARVSSLTPTDTSAVRYWNGITWSSSVPSGATMFSASDSPAASLSVVHVDEMDMFVAGYAEFPAFPMPGVDSVLVRVASRPEGPWSTSVAIRNATDCAPGCYAGYVHSQLSGIDHLGTTLYDPDHWFPGGGQVRMTRGRVDLEPPAPGTCRSGFADVWSDHAFCVEIAWLAGSGITEGYADATFRPTVGVTRQALAAWFHRAAGGPAGPGCGTPPFSDVPTGHPFCGEIAWLADAGIGEGYSDGTFRPTADVTRQALAAWFYREAGAPLGPAPTCSVAPFPDVTPDDPFCGEIAWLADSGIAEGYPDGRFRPDRGVTRQAAAAFFERAA